MHQSVLSYEEFVTYIQENLEAVLNESCQAEVTLTEIAKNNGVRSAVLTARQEGKNAAPVFYMRDIYEQYLRGTAADDLIDQMVAVSRQELRPVLASWGQWFESFENVRDHIIMKVVNYERNRHQLEACPYIRQLDLALTFRILVEEEKTQIGTVLVNQMLMQQWQVTAEELYAQAVDNMRRLWEDVLEPVQDMARELVDPSMSESFEQWMEETLEIQEAPLYVLTNEIRLNGAVTLFYTDAVKRLASAMQSDIFVLPSSIHEVLLMPVTEDMSAWDMRQIVEEVNHQLVAEEERLSDHVYRYLYRGDKLIIAA